MIVTKIYFFRRSLLILFFGEREYFQIRHSDPVRGVFLVCKKLFVYPVRSIALGGISEARKTKYCVFFVDAGSGNKLKIENKHIRWKNLYKTGFKRECLKFFMFSHPNTMSKFSEYYLLNIQNLFFQQEEKKIKKFQETVEKKKKNIMVQIGYIGGECTSNNT